MSAPHLKSKSSSQQLQVQRQLPRARTPAPPRERIQQQNKRWIRLRSRVAVFGDATFAHHDNRCLADGHGQQAPRYTIPSEAAEAPELGLFSALAVGFVEDEAGGYSGVEGFDLE